MAQPSFRRPWWRRQYLSVRSLMLIVLVVGGTLGWLIHRAKVQRDAVRAIYVAGGTVRYDFEQITPSQPLGPKWLVDLIGIDFLANVTSVSFWRSESTIGYTPPLRDAVLADVGRLPRLERLDAYSMLVTDAGMAHLAGLTQLSSLEIEGAPELTDAGLAHLAGLVHLSTFVVSDQTSVTPGGLYRLQQERPGLRIDINGLGQMSEAHLDLQGRSVGPGAVPPAPQ